jgi:ribosomal protein S26
MPHTVAHVKCFRCGDRVPKDTFPDHYESDCPEL